jgi:hypothetical protein
MDNQDQREARSRSAIALVLRYLKPEQPMGRNDL